MDNCKKYKANIYKSVYEDNYDDGLVDDSEQISLVVDSKYFATAKEAVEYFIDEFHTETYFSKPEAVDNGDVRFSATLKKNDDGWFDFTEPTENDIELWKTNKINLWNVEYSLVLKVLEDVPEKELDEIISTL